MHALRKDIKNVDRLKKRSDFLRAHHNGQKWVSGSMVVQAVDAAPDTATANETPAEKPRFGLTVTKKTFKKAVDRNRTKRRLRAVCYDVLPAIAATDKDYVIIGRAASRDAPYEALVKDLKWCLKRMDCLK